jgi:anaerobic selenocysteine-containing dehydrogenase
MDVAGGNIIRGRFFGLGRMEGWGPELLTEEQRRKKIGFGKYPLLDWAGITPREATIEQILRGTPYPIKAAWIQGSNTFTSASAFGKRVHGALKTLDFNVVVDLFMTPTAMAAADMVLPAATYPERDGLAITVGATTCVGLINRAIEPVGECKSDMEINLEVGKRLNPELWPWKNVQEMFSSMLKSVGVTYEAFREMGWAYDVFEYKKYEKGLLRQDKKEGFDTPTGKAELYSTILEKCGLDPLPYYEEPPESPVSTPEIAREYPLILTTGARSWSFFHSEHRQIPLLRRMNPDPITEVHPETAEKLGIKDGDWIYIESRHGRCQQRAKLTKGIHPRVIHSQHGWWFPEQSGPEPNLFGVWESNINLLLPSGWTGRSGLGYPYKSQMCKVYKKEA